MKKYLITMLICLFLHPHSIALAEIDVSSMTFDELIELQAQITQEITNRPEWNNVEVPAGGYEVGVDIPVGRWTISVGDDVSICMITYGSELNESKTDVDASCENYAVLQLGNNATWGNGLSTSIELTEGNYICIWYSNVIFTTYINPSFDFK